MRHIAAALLIPACAMLSPVAHAQFGRGNNDWNTAGLDAQRSSWVHTDPKISIESLSKPGFTITWKIALKDSKGSGSAGLPILLNRYIGYRGFRSFAFVGAAGDNVYTVDTDLSRIEWHQHFAPSAPLPPGCSASTVPGVARPSGTAFPAIAVGRGGGFGRGGPAHSSVGEAGEGAVTLSAGGRANAAFAPPPAYGGRAEAGRGGRAGEAGRGGRGMDNSARRMQNSLYILTADGILHSVWLSSGEVSEDAVKFLPPGAGARGLILVDNVAYAATSSACGGSSGISALNLASKEVTSWKPEGGAVVGEDGPAIGPDGTLYVASAGGSAGVSALEAKTLERKDWYASDSGDLASSPVIFEYKDRALAAVASKSGKILLLDTKSLGGADHRTPLFSASTDGSPDGLASWQDAAGIRYLIAAASGAIRSWKVVERNGSPALEPAWTSPEIASPLAPMIVNGVVFAASKGSRSSPAVLYALDATNGKALWNSGRLITSYVADSGLSAGDTQVYLGTADGTLYAFGFPIEH